MHIIAVVALCEDRMVRGTCLCPWIRGQLKTSIQSEAQEHCNGGMQRAQFHRVISVPGEKEFPLGESWRTGWGKIRGARPRAQTGKRTLELWTRTDRR